jgi:hypothetical protein
LAARLFHSAGRLSVAHPTESPLKLDQMAAAILAADQTLRPARDYGPRLPSFCLIEVDPGNETVG